MDLAKVLAQLHTELENLDAAIVSLERLQEAIRHHQGPAELVRQVRRRRRRGQETESAPDTGDTARTDGSAESTPATRGGKSSEQSRKRG